MPELAVELASHDLGEPDDGVALGALEAGERLAEVGMHLGGWQAGVEAVGVEGGIGPIGAQAQPAVTGGGRAIGSGSTMGSSLNGRHGNPPWVVRRRGDYFRGD